MSYGWLECEVDDFPGWADNVVRFVLFDNYRDVWLSINKESDDIKVGADGTSLMRVEILEREGLASLVRLPPGAHRVKERVYWVHSHHLRTEFKEAK